MPYASSEVTSWAFLTLLFIFSVTRPASKDKEKRNTLGVYRKWNKKSERKGHCGIFCLPTIRLCLPLKVVDGIQLLGVRQKIISRSAQKMWELAQMKELIYVREIKIESGPITFSVTLRVNFHTQWATYKSLTFPIFCDCGSLRGSSCAKRSFLSLLYFLFIMVQYKFFLSLCGLDHVKENNKRDRKERSGRNYISLFTALSSNACCRNHFMSREIRNAALRFFVQAYRLSVILFLLFL